MTEGQTAPHLPLAASRPLLGLTILVVEDSRYACEALRLMCLRSGARIRRADCLASARRHLQVYRPSAVIIDLGLPDGRGADLIEQLNRAHPRVAVLLGTSGDEFAEDEAVAAGADGFLRKPLTSLALFQTALLAALPQGQGCWRRIMPDEAIHPDPLAYRDDLAHVADVLGTGGDGRTLDYVAQFLGGLARSAQDTPLAEAAAALASCRAQGAPHGSDTARLAGLLQDRLRVPVAL